LLLSVPVLIAVKVQNFSKFWILTIMNYIEMVESIAFSPGFFFAGEKLTYCFFI
jgi:hypothetical protein